MTDTGSLIQLHHHNNFELLEKISDKNGILYYDSKSVYIPVSKREGNAIGAEEDGIFVNGLTTLNTDQYNILSRFSFKNNNLHFDDIVVSREYDDTSIKLMISELWKELESLIVPDEPTGESNFITKDNLYILTSDNLTFITK